MKKKTVDAFQRLPFSNFSRRGGSAAMLLILERGQPCPQHVVTDMAVRWYVYFQRCQEAAARLHKEERMNDNNPIQLRNEHEDEIREYLAHFDLFIGNVQEGKDYIAHAFRRFMRTIEMIPPAPEPDSQLLELGANPYFVTILLQRFHAYHLTLSNFFGEGHLPEGKGVQVMSNARYHERHEFEFDHFNVETDRFPYPDEQFDVVLCCELLEHVSHNPTAMLCEIHRVLKPQGLLLITTPNVLACQNFLKLAVGQNMYDRYSGYGIYGRHNREYTPQEVTHLLQACSFEILKIQVEDIHPHSRWLVRLLKRLRTVWRDNIFVMAQARGFPCEAYPDVLYRSMTQE